MVERWSGGQRHGGCKALLVVCCMLPIGGCGVVVRGVHSAATAIGEASEDRLGRQGPLDPTERVWAETGWTYFQANRNPETLLVGATAGSPWTSMWHVGDQLAALVAAHELGLVDAVEFDHNLSGILAFLNTMKLFRGQLPNTLYSVADRRMVDYGMQTAEIGWSAVDIGRLLVWLGITKARYPQYASFIDRVVLRWDFCALLDDDGRPLAAVPAGDRLERYRETSRGYEDYAFLGFRLWGFDVPGPPPPAARLQVSGLYFPTDEGPERSNPQLAGPSLLAGLEVNWDRPDDLLSPDTEHTDPAAALLAEQVYDVQALRFEETGVLTARTSYRRQSDPLYVYNAILARGYAWNVVTPDGNWVPNLALLSTRATFGLWALWPGDYTDRLVEVIQYARDGERGWLEGRYEDTGGYEWTITATTNAMVLEALLHKVQGKLLRPAPGATPIVQVIRTEGFDTPDRCLPGARAMPGG